MSEKKYESLGVDQEKQQSEPTLVEKAQAEELKNRKDKFTSISSPEQTAKALAHTTQHQQDYRTSKTGETTSAPNGRLESVLGGGNYSEEQLSPSTVQPSVDKAKTDEAKKEDK